MRPGSLQGKRILVTRAREQSSRLQQLLEDAGAEVIAIPAIEIVPPDSYDSLDMAIHQLAEYDWLVFTSANAVQAMHGRALHLSVPLHAPETLSIAAIGNSTADSIRAVGLPVHLVPPAAVAESLAASLVPLANGKRILLVRAKDARDILPNALSAAGALVTIAVAYQTILPAPSVEQLRALAVHPEHRLDAITFTSASSVHHLATLADAAGFPLESLLKVSIGPITTAALREHGWQADAEAAAASMEALVAACANALQLRG